ncbi:N-acetyltransferase [Nitratireductor sp. StC3]|uniref:GNAT family N-acetyltransferase n=1 Tax=Nitratireductor sp. StC3 TaxID=2126741 RepID=UPI001FDF63F6|nr:N-acetyltransferase [Nitratireductor sp. StC3]
MDQHEFFPLMALVPPLPAAPGTGAGATTITLETDADALAREALLDRAMGPGRTRKSSERLRRGRLPAAGLAFAARDGAGRLVGTVRLWNVAAARSPSPSGLLLLGPLAVDPSLKGAGVGAALMRHAIGEAGRLGHGAILLVGDPDYYRRFGFSADKTDALAMPGPYEKHRLLALELRPAALDGASGVLGACGKRSPRSRARGMAA